MAFSQQLLLSMPAFLLGILIVGSEIILSILGLVMVRRIIPHHRLKLHNDVAGPIYGTLGVVYAVLLAFMVVIVWQNFDRAALNVENEANSVSDLYKDAECFPDNFKQEVRGLVNEYAKVVINEEWQMLGRGEESPHAAEIVQKLWKVYSSYAPKTATEQTFYAESVGKLNELGDFRTVRLAESRSGVNPLLWFVLITGGIVTVTFTYLFGAENFKAQAVMAVLLAILISLILLTILLLDYPFTGSIRISPRAFEQVLACKY